MLSSSEEEIEEMLREQIIRQRRNFEERRLFDIQNPRQFREKYRLPIKAFEYL